VIYPVLILLAGLFLQGLMLLFRGDRFRFLAVEGISAIIFAGSTFNIIWLAQRVSDALPLLNLLEDQPLLRLPRAALFLAAFIVSRAIVSSRELPQKRKPEVLFLLSFVVLFCELLILSQNILLSCLLLISLSWIGNYLSGLAFRGRAEGEALLKGWIQASLVTSFGLGSVLLLIWISGGSSYSLLAKGFVASQGSAFQSLVGILALFSPYFLAGGLFPFHFLSMDRDQGVPWSVQLVFVVIMQGAILLSLWKISVEVLYVPGASSSLGLDILQLASLAGGFWLALFALSQDNSKRLFSSIIGASWAMVLAAGAHPTELSASAVAYAFSSIVLWAALMGFTWSRLQEWAGGEKMNQVFGLAREFRASGLFLLIALSAAVGVPGFSGLPVSFHLLAAVIEQKSLIFLFAQTALMALVVLSFFRVGTDLLFRGDKQDFRKVDGVHYAALDYVGVIFLGASILFLGIFWTRVFAALSETAKVFLN
jgi:NADH:ubiquinone oxidoreductase subunit 2 (subunit N)